MRIVRSLCVAALAAAITGCGAAGRLVEREDPFVRTPVAEQSVRLHVQNRNFSDARLYALALGKRTRLGVVGGKRDAVFSIPWPHAEPMRIEIDLLAGPKCTTRAIEVDPGDTLDLQIQPVLYDTRACSRS